MSEKLSVLVVEDEKDISDLMSVHLRRDGYLVTQVADGEEALQSLKASEYHLLLLDWMLPGVSGLEVCKKIRGGMSAKTAPQVPVLMVTARVNPSDIVTGLESGADDYLTKPFEIPVLLARVRALLRRMKLMPSVESKKFQLGKLIVDTDKYELICGKRPVQLTTSEFKLLITLLKHQGKVLTREQLIDFVRGEDVSVVDRTIDTHVFGLRKKLGECGELVETVRGIGYRIKN